MVSLIAHSAYSYKTSTLMLPQFMDWLHKNGENTFALTERNNIRSHIKAFALATQYNFHFIPGIELNVCLQENQDNSLPINIQTLMLYARNTQGEEDIIHLFNNQEKIDDDTYYTALSTLQQYTQNNNLICLMGGNNNYSYADIDKIATLFDTTHFYLDCDISYSYYQQYINNTKYPHVINNDINYLNQSDITSYNMFVGMQLLRNNPKLASQLFQTEDHSPQYGWSMTDDTLNAFISNTSFNISQSIIEESQHNKNNIISQCTMKSFPHAEKLGNGTAELRKRVEMGWKNLRKDTCYAQESKERLDYELKVIEEKNFSAYFVNMSTIINASQDLGIMRGPARGSAAGSEVCYVTGITSVDPLKFNLYFERFLNPERHNFPDIDFDTSTAMLVSNAKNGDTHNRVASGIITSREMIINYLCGQHEFNFAAYVNNEMTLTPITIFKALCRYMDISPADANIITTGEFKDHFINDNKYTGWLKNAVQAYWPIRNNQGEKILDSQLWDTVWGNVDVYMDICYTLNKMPYNSSIAASAVIMTKKPSILPIRDHAITFNSHDLEDINYIKYDMLSIDSLNIILYFYGLNPDWQKTDDPSVWETLQNADTDFVFQFSGDGMRQLLLNTSPQNIEDLSAITAVNRPGPMEMGYVDKYTQLKEGTLHLHDEDLCLAIILKRAFGEHHSGLVLYQEDVMKICNDGAGFTLGEADQIRRGMGKKDIEAMMPYKDKFIHNWKYSHIYRVNNINYLSGDNITLDNGTIITVDELCKSTQQDCIITDINAEKIWDGLEKFAGYGFNKSHAVAYSIISYWTAKAWTEHKNQMLEYYLNYGTATQKDTACTYVLNHGYKILFPTFKNGIGNIFQFHERYITEERGNSYIHFPLENMSEDDNQNLYSSPMAFLFANTKDSTCAIMQGCYDYLFDAKIVDRDGLKTFVKGLMPSLRKKLITQLEDNYTTFTDLLDSIKLIGAIQSWNVDDTKYNIMITKRGKPVEVVILLHGNTQKIASYYMKYYGIFPFLSSYPFNEKFICNNIFPIIGLLKNQLQFKKLDHDTQLLILKNTLRDEVKRFSKDDVYGLFIGLHLVVMLVDYVVWEDNIIKLTVRFNDKIHTFFISHRESFNSFAGGHDIYEDSFQWFDKSLAVLRKLKKKNVFYMNIMFNPYIDKHLNFMLNSNIIKMW